MSTLINGYNETIANEKVSAAIVNSIRDGVGFERSISKELFGGQDRSFDWLDLLVRRTFLLAKVVCVPCRKRA